MVCSQCNCEYTPKPKAKPWDKRGNKSKYCDHCRRLLQCIRVKMCREKKKLHTELFGKELPTYTCTAYLSNVGLDYVSLRLRSSNA